MNPPDVPAAEPTHTEAATSNGTHNTHSKVIGYLLWIFGFTGAHRFYYGRQKTGLLWLCTGGLFLIGWLVDLFLIPSMDRSADRRYVFGRLDYSIAWLLLTFLGMFGAHRAYQGKWLTAVLLFGYSMFSATLGFWPLLFLLPVMGYDFLTLNSQISEQNASSNELLRQGSV